MYNGIKLEVVDSNVPYTALVFTEGKAPRFAAHNKYRDAQQWCKANAEYDDDMWVILQNGKVSFHGIIEDIIV